jgi:uncharacterized protein YfdQ (DUF2303 family)
MQTETDMQKILETVQKLAETEVIRMDEFSEVHPALVVVPQGKEIVDLQEYIDQLRDAPKRHKGALSFLRVESLIRYVDELGADWLQTARLYAKLGQVENPTPDFSIVLNDHTGEMPGNRDFVARFSPAPSDQFRFWSKPSELVTPAQFAEMIEDHMLDIVDVHSLEDIGRICGRLESALGSPASGAIELLELANRFRVSVQSQVASGHNQTSGAQVASLETYHSAETRPPKWFILRAPIFRGGDEYLIPVRLRYRVEEKGVRWQWLPFAIQEIYQDACERIAVGIHKETSIPLFYC